MELVGPDQRESQTLVARPILGALVSASEQRYVRQRKILRTIASPSLSSVRRVLFPHTPRAADVTGEHGMVKAQLHAVTATESDDNCDIFPKIPPRRAARKRKQSSTLLANASTSGTSSKSRRRGKDAKLKIGRGNSSKHANKRKRVDNLSCGEKMRISETRPDEECNKLASESFSDQSFCSIIHETNMMNSPLNFDKKTYLSQTDESVKLTMSGETSDENVESSAKVDPNNNDTELPSSRKKKKATNVFNSSRVEPTNMKGINKPLPERNSRINKIRPVQEVGPWNVLVEEQASDDCAAEIFTSYCSPPPATQVTSADQLAPHETFSEQTVAAGSESSNFTPRGHHCLRNDDVLSIESKLLCGVALPEKLSDGDCMSSGAQERKPLDTLKTHAGKSSSGDKTRSRSSDRLRPPAVKRHSGSKSSNHQNFGSVLSNSYASRSVQCADHQRLQCRDKSTPRSGRKNSISLKLNANVRNKTEAKVGEYETYDGGSQCSSNEQMSLSKMSRRSRSSTRVTALLSSPGPESSTLSLGLRNKAASGYRREDHLTARNSPTKQWKTHMTKNRTAKRSSSTKGTRRRTQPACPRALWLLTPDFSEEYARALVPVINKRSKRTIKRGGKADTVLLSREDLDAYFILLEEDVVVRELLERDACHVYADKYLLAMVFVYFLRARLPLRKYDRLHFFAALYLAHDLEEDDDAPKHELVHWLVKDEIVRSLVADELETSQRTGSKFDDEGRLAWFPSSADLVCQLHRPASSFVGCHPKQSVVTKMRTCRTHCMKRLLLLTRDLLFWGMNCRAIVSKANCEKVMACEKQHWAWRRQRPDHHGDCVRHSHWAARRRANLLQNARSEAACQMCCAARAPRTELDVSSPAPADGRASASKGDKDSGYESMLVGSGGDHEPIFVEKRPNLSAFTILHEASPPLPKEKTPHETSMNTSDEIFPPAPKQLAVQQKMTNHHPSPALNKTKRRLLLSLKSTEMLKEAQLRDEVWTTAQKLPQKHSPHRTNTSLTRREEQRRKSKRNITEFICSCSEETIPKNSGSGCPNEISDRILLQLTPRKPTLELSDHSMRPKNLLPLFDHFHVCDSAKSGSMDTNRDSGIVQIRGNEGKNVCYDSQASKKIVMLGSLKKRFSYPKDMNVFTDKFQNSRYPRPSNATQVPWLNDNSLQRGCSTVSRDPSTGSDRLSQADTVIL